MNRKIKRRNKALEEDLKNTTILEMRKTMDVGGKAKVLDKPTMNLGKTIPFEQVEEIVKTTDSMQIVAKSFKNIEETDVRRLSEASKAILRSYDLAVRKIKATYRDIIETKKAIGTEFMTVQILIKRYEEFSDTKKILQVINVFTKEVETLLSFGKGIWFSNELVLESADYINKMIPIARIITSDAIIVNMIRWEEIADLLIKQGKISSPEKGIIESYVGAINSNIRNGYFLKFGHLLIARIRPNDPECMVLFSGETIQRMNKVYSHHRSNNRNSIISKSNYLNKFMSNVSFQKQKDRDLKEKLDVEVNVQKQKEKKEEQEILKREKTISKEELELAKAKEIKETETFEEEVPNLKAKNIDETDVVTEDTIVSKNDNFVIDEKSTQEEVQEIKDEEVQEIKDEEVQEIKDEVVEIKNEKSTPDLQETLNRPSLFTNMSNDEEVVEITDDSSLPSLSSNSGTKKAVAGSKKAPKKTKAKSKTKKTKAKTAN